MRLWRVLFAIAGVAGPLGCEPTGPGVVEPRSLVVPAAGRYQATLVGYRSRSCDEPLSPPVGTLEAAAQMGFLLQGEVSLSGGQIWPFGEVVLRPGDSADPVAGPSWVGSARARAERWGCALQASVQAQYFPVGAEQGSLHVRTRYALAEGRCSLRLPCEDAAVWWLVHFP
ncbi:MAG: hypothetical protein RMK29_10820 [Myxococcales bacterium]|nr:hypothetical protein [Myxococcota bacterium]MDW8282197.1 hypothetical protein [Myxococcales bacterium]